MEEIKLKTKKLNNKLVSDIKYKYKHKLDIEDYVYLTSFCRYCEINEPSIIEIHHIDRNRNNNNISNLIGLCPTCHKLLHRGIIDIFNKDGMIFITKVEKDNIFQKIKESSSPLPPQFPIEHERE